MKAREQIVEIETGAVDYMPGLSSNEKKQRLSRMSYQAFLRDVVHAEPAVVKYYHGRPWANGASAPMRCPRSIAGHSICPAFRE